MLRHLTVVSINPLNMELGTLFLLVTYGQYVLGYYHESSISVISPNLLGFREQSLFGYSTTYQDKYRRLIISAPRADHEGKIFSVNLSNNLTISPININMEQDGDTGMRNSSEDYLLGVTVRSTNSYFVTCAPRTTPKILMNHRYESLVNSQCFIGTSPDKVDRLLVGSNLITRNFNGGITGFGWSIHLNSFMFISSPVVGRGGVLVIDQSTSQNYMHLVYNNRSYESFGYNVISGRFISDSESLVISALKGDWGQGKVTFYALGYFGYNNKEWELSDGEVGSMYGAVLAGANLGGNRSSLLVGAPTYAEPSTYDAGAVYIYIPNYGSNIMTLKRIIAASSKGSYFGAAIVSAGDMDGDGLDEVAIAAPYENDGRGAVYMYSGAGLLADRPWFQKLTVEGFQAFGFSLTALNNISDNGCKGIAIGAPDSNKVAIFRGIPAVTLTLFKEFPNLQKRKNKDFFEFLSGMLVVYPKSMKSIEADISVKIELIHPSAKLVGAISDGTLTYNVSLKGQPAALNKTIKVLTPSHGNYEQKISYKISASLIKDPTSQTKFTSSLVMLSEASTLLLIGSELVAECDGDCNPKLRVDFATTIPRPYITGSTNNEIVRVSLTNEGDVAYSACVIVRADGVRVLQPPSDCTRKTDGEILTCKPRHGIRNNETWETGDIRLETSYLTSSDESFKIYYDAYNHCGNESERRHYEQTFKLRPVSDGIIIQGTSNNKEMVNMTAEDVNVGKRLQHTYKISNPGPTSWVGVDCDVLLPIMQNKDIIESYVTVSSSSYISNCNVTPSDADVKSMKATCYIGELRKTSVVNVYVSILVLPRKLENIVEKQDVELKSEVILKLDKDQKSYSITNTLHYNYESISSWIIILAIILGLILVIMSVIVLYKCGFLQRKNKQKQETLLNSIKRGQMPSQEDNDERTIES